MKTEPVKLAIVIPAFKSNFISETLMSLAQQSCKSFRVYIGNDAGDPKIKNIAESFSDKLDIEYIFFSENLGSTSLVKAWDRCIKMTKSEPWLWLLPDDDFISEDCVEGLLNTIKEDDSFQLYRFTAAMTDQIGRIIKRNDSFPPIESSYLSFMEKVHYRRFSTLAEYIFSRDVFEKYAGFPELPLAWGSDDAAWYLFGSEKGIKSINVGTVFLRQSSFNISNNYTKLGKTKFFALVTLFQLLIKYKVFLNDIDKYKRDFDFEASTQFFIFNEMRQLKVKLSFKDIICLGIISSSFWSGGILKNIYRFWLNNFKVISNT